MNKNILYGVTLLIALLLGYAYISNTRNTDTMTFTQGENIVSDNNVGGKIATIYKSPTCGCCVGFTGILKREGYTVNIESTEDMSVIKEKYGIPREMESCHTTIIDGYVIEGHVPMEILDKLLSEKPAIDGIALPNMPSGSPGMPGPKRAPFTIYQITDGVYSEYLTI